MEVRLRILDGPNAGTEYAIAGPVVRLGRGEENDIVLPDSNASRNHAEVVRDARGSYVVRDLGSRNGIFVNRKKTPQAPLRNGDKVVIGSTTVEFVAIGAGGGAAASEGTGSPLVRWAAVAILALVVGFVGVTIAGGGKKGGGRGVTVGTGGGGEPDPGDVSLGNLLAGGGGKEGGVGVGRNDSTKPKSTGVALPTPVQASEGQISNLVNEGDRAAASGKLVDARAYYAQAAKLDPECERCANKLKKVEKEIERKIDAAMSSGRGYFETGRYDQALREFEEVKLLDPDPGSLNNGNATRYIEDIKRLRANE